MASLSNFNAPGRFNLNKILLLTALRLAPGQERISSLRGDEDGAFGSSPVAHAELNVPTDTFTFSFMFSKAPPWAITVLDCTSKINPDGSAERKEKEALLKAGAQRRCERAEAGGRAEPRLRGRTQPCGRAAPAACKRQREGPSAQGATLRSPTEPEEPIQVKPTDQKHQPKKYPRQKNPTKAPQGWRGADGRSKAEHFRITTAPSPAVKG